MKKFKTIYGAQTTNRFEEIFLLPRDRRFLPLWNKNYLTDIYRNIQTFAFQVLRECSSWASRNGAVQMFLYTLNRNKLAGKFVKRARFLFVLRKYIFSNGE